MRMRTWTAVSLSVVAISACGGQDGKSRPEAASSTVPAGPKALAGVGCAAAGATPSSGGTPILGIHHVPSLTRDRYDAVVRRLTNGHDRLQSVSDGNVEGLLVHVAGEGDDGFWIIDVWASQDAVDRFAQRVRPIAQSVGIEQPMKTYPIHTFLTC
jgi:hypothetical protein